jgi:hypothetical protein
LKTANGFIGEKFQRAVAASGEGDQRGIADAITATDLESTVLNFSQTRVNVISAELERASAGLEHYMIDAYV